MKLSSPNKCGGAKERANLRDPTKTEILYVVSLIGSCILFFLSISLLMGNGANVVIPYVALFAAIALSSSTLIVGVARTQKTVFQQAETKPVMPSVQAPIEKPVIKPVTVASPAKSEPIIQRVENNYREQKIEPIELLITLPKDNQTQESSIAQPASEAKTEKQKIIKPTEKTSTKTNATKSTANKKTATKRAKARKTK